MQVNYLFTHPTQTCPSSPPPPPLLPPPATISGHIRLADFDLSSPIARAPLAVAVQRRSFVGTPEYVSPEVVDGSGSSAAVDIWSFGVLLYEMTFGHTPFAGPTMQETFANIVSKELKFPSKHSASREVFRCPPPPHFMFCVLPSSSHVLRPSLLLSSSLSRSST